MYQRHSTTVSSVNYELQFSNCTEFPTKHHPAAWKSPKSSSATSCGPCSLADSDVSGSSFAVAESFVSADCSRLSLDGDTGGDLASAATGESGAGGGGGGLSNIVESFRLAFSSNDRLFRPCSKNLDLMVPPGFCCPGKKKNAVIGW